jgi:Cytochrome C oxidase, cbb3-type, subunit III
MKQNLVLMGLVAGSLLIAGPHAAAASGTTGKSLVGEGISIELGRRDFINYCGSCHGADATGNGYLTEFLNLAVPDLTKLTKRNAGKFPDERVVEVIDGRADVKVHGMRDMPVWGDWFNAEAVAPDMDKDSRELVVQDRIQSLVTFLKSIQVN